MQRLKLPWKWLLAHGRGAHVAMCSVPFFPTPAQEHACTVRAHAYNITPPIWGSLWSHLDCRHSWKPLRSRPCTCAGAPTRWVKATCFYVKREIFDLCFDFCCIAEWSVPIFLHLLYLTAAFILSPCDFSSVDIFQSSRRKKKKTLSRLKMSVTRKMKSWGNFLMIRS